MKRNQDDGMTLVELVIGLAVAAMLLLGIASVFSQGLKSQQEQAARDAMTGKLNHVSSYLNESIRNATTATVSANNSRINMAVLKNSGTATIECRSFVVNDGKLWYMTYMPGGGGAPTFMPSSSSWKQLTNGLVDPIPGGDPFGFIKQDGAFKYNLKMKSGDVEVAIQDGGYPRGKLKVAGADCG